MYISDATSTSFFQISFEMSETVIILSKASSSILRSSFSTITLNFSGILACIILNRSDIVALDRIHYYWSFHSMGFVLFMENVNYIILLRESNYSRQYSYNDTFKQIYLYLSRRFEKKQKMDKPFQVYKKHINASNDSNYCLNFSFSILKP